jgi:hypothetical protein
MGSSRQFDAKVDRKKSRRHESEHKSFGHVSSSMLGALGVVHLYDAFGNVPSPIEITEKRHEYFSLKEKVSMFVKAFKAFKKLFQ